MAAGVKGTATRVVECGCIVCRDNAGRLGMSVPLRAEVPLGLFAAASGDTHGLVWQAHDPSMVGQIVRRQTGLRGVR